MSGWMSWWGGGAAAKQKKTQQMTKNAVLGIDSHVDMLRKKKAHLDSVIADLDAQSRAVVGKNDKEALRILKHMKMKQKEREQTENAIMSMEQQKSSLNNATGLQDSVRNMEAVNSALNHIHKDISVDKVHDMMDSINEHTAMNEEIAQAMAAPAGQMDEEDLDEELERLRQEQLDEEMLKTGTVPSDKISSLPAAGNKEIKSKPVAQQEDDEEAELRKLQAEMAI